MNYNKLTFKIVSIVMYFSLNVLGQELKVSMDKDVYTVAVGERAKLLISIKNTSEKDMFLKGVVDLGEKGVMLNAVSLSDNRSHFTSKRLYGNAGVIHDPNAKILLKKGQSKQLFFEWSPKNKDIGKRSFKLHKNGYCFKDCKLIVNVKGGREKGQ